MQFDANQGRILTLPSTNLLDLNSYCDLIRVLGKTIIQAPRRTTICHALARGWILSCLSLSLLFYFFSALTEYIYMWVSLDITSEFFGVYWFLLRFNTDANYTIIIDKYVYTSWNFGK